MRARARSRPVSRRSFLTGLGVLATSPALADTPLAERLFGVREDDTPLFASAYRMANGGFGVGIVDELGQVLSMISLPGRGHGFAVDPGGRRFVAFARRPGNFAVVVRSGQAVAPEVLTTPVGRHFYGHGCFSGDGRVLYSVENDFDHARGVIGLYDVSGVQTRRLGEFDSHGVGPHEAVLSRDGRVLIVANGGIETHPDRGREKLNLASMTPSVVFLDAASGDLLTSHVLGPEAHQLSLRHMALDGRGRAWVGGQFEGAGDARPPLVGIFSLDAPPAMCGLPAAVSEGLENYIGSVAANAAGEVVATSAPRGGKILFWNVQSGSFLGALGIQDGCGLAPIDQDGFVVSDGNGGLSVVSDPAEPADVIAPATWLLLGQSHDLPDVSAGPRRGDTPRNRLFSR